MLTGINKKIELAANLAIIIVACLLATVLIKNNLLAGRAAQSASNVQSENQQVNGAHLSSLSINWKESRQTLVLAISNTCHFCTDSAPFYKRLAQNRGDTRVVAVFPQPIEDGREYLERLGVSVDEVKQVGLDQIGVRGTPTLLLVDNSGVVKDSWVGRLPPEQEKSVLDALRGQ
jgi:thioredoxin-related protein